MRRAVIMAGGEGRRLRPLTEFIPKPLISLGGRPLIEIMIQQLREADVTEIILAVHYKADMFRDHLGDGSRLGVHLEYVIEPTPLGTIGALTLLRDRLTGPCFVVNADILTTCDFRAMWDFHAAQDHAAMTVGMSLYPVEVPVGTLVLQHGCVMGTETDRWKSYPINTGIYILDREAIALLPSYGAVDATDMIRTLVDRGQVVAAYMIRDYWRDIGRPEDYEQADRDIAEGLLLGRIA